MPSAATTYSGSHPTPSGTQAQRNAPSNTGGVNNATAPTTCSLTGDTSSSHRRNTGISPTDPHTTTRLPSHTPKAAVDTSLDT